MVTRQKQTKCPVCDGTQNNFWKCDPRYRECRSCKSVWLLMDGKSTYEKEYYDRGKTGWFMKLVDKFAFWDRYLTLDLSKENKILEIGFGQGKLLKELKAKGYSVWGVEQSEYAREKMKKLLGDEFVLDEIEKIKEKFDVVVMYHVLEHIENPKDYVKKVKGLLSPNGRLVVRVPNVESWEANLAGKEWYHLDFPNHKILFSEAGLVKMFEEVGYRDIKSRNFFGEYRQVMGYSILSHFGLKLNKWLMIPYQMVTIPILWIFSLLVAQHGVIEVEGRVGTSNSNT